MESKALPQLTTRKLNGSNFVQWSRAVTIALTGLGFDDHLTQSAPTISPTTDDKSVKQWKQMDAQIVALLWNSMESQVADMCGHLGTCKDIWEYAQLLFSSDLTRMYDLSSQYFQLQQNNSSVTDYFASFKRLVEELNSVLPITTDAKTQQEQREQMAVMKFLASLKSYFEPLRSQILGSASLPSLAETYQRVLRSTSREIVPTPVPDNSALVTQAQPIAGRGDGNPRRGHGGFRGGYRGGYGGRGRGGRPHCMNCDKDGHFKETCWDLIGRPARFAHAAVTSDIHPPPRTPAVSDQISISSEEYSQFLQFQAAQQASSPSTSLAQKGTPTACLTSRTRPWVIDSAATDHLTGISTLFSSLESSSSLPPVTLADGSSMPVEGIGTVHLSPFLSLSSVLYISRSPFNLLSVGKLTKELNACVSFFPDSVLIQDLTTRRTIGVGHESDGLYYFDGAPTSTPTACPATVSPHQIHCRLGHPSLANLKLLVPSLSNLSTLECESCQLGKHHRVQFAPRVNKRVSSPFELVHSDVWGPHRILSVRGFRYFVSFVDDYSRTTWIYLMKNRSELFSIFCAFCNEITTQFNVPVKILRSDNAQEYFSDPFTTYMAQNGMLHQSSCVHTPQQNGVAERKNRHLLEVTRTLLFEMRVPKVFWGDAVLTACHLINRMPSHVLDGCTPHATLFPTTPPFPVAPRVFGCVCFVHQLSPGTDKLDPRAIKCVFLGYSRTQKGYRCYSPSLRRFFVSADVTFFESTPFYSESHTINDPEFMIPLPLALPPKAGLDRPDLQTYTRRHQIVETIPDSAAPPLASEASDPPPSASDLPIALRKGKRTCTSHPISNFVSYNHFSPTFSSFVASLSTVSLPKSTAEALSHSGWRQAMEDEMLALRETGTWELVSLPPGKSVVGCRWVYTVKMHPDGTLDRLKARLVAKGYTQVYGLDYSETFSPVAKIASVRLFISLAATYHWPLHQLDVKNAFLNGTLSEEVYMEQPPGFVAQGESSMVCKLKKSLYGLKQSSRAWFGRFSEVVVDFGLQRCGVDHSVFYRHSSAGRILLVVYVDDIVITGDDSKGIQELKLFLQKQFQTKDLGQLRYFLGIEVARSSEGICLSQRKYVLDLLSETGMLGSKPLDSPMDPNTKLLPDQGELLDDPGQYRRLVGKLNYLTVTRPDVAFAVSVISQFMDCPRKTHWDAVIRILRYLKGAPGRGLLYKDHGHIRVKGYTDADWAGSPGDRRSTTGYCVMVGGNLVSWKSKKQTVVARSSAESEYRAMAHTTCELVWVKHLLEELGFAPVTSMGLLCDNQAAVHIASNPVFHERTKHIEVDCHFVREKILQNCIHTVYVKSADQLADLFTKALGGIRVKYICNKLGAYDMYAPA